MKAKLRDLTWRTSGGTAKARRQEHAGFTLVEVMVTLALTMIMMYLFAQIFKITADFVTRNKGIAENDQSARTLTTLMKSDLQSRTMRYLVPFQVNSPYTPVGIDAQRLGYFYYSENNPLDDTDDVLQFTVQLPKPDSPFYGRATFLPSQQWTGGTNYASGAYVAPKTPNGFIYCATTAGTSGGAEPVPWPTPAGAVSTTPDGSVIWTCVDSTLQPDGDDGIAHYLTSGAGLSVMDPTANFAVNNTGASQYAEVSYFLRHGNLCRRVLLIRQPNNTLGSGGTQPGLASAPINNGPYPGNFWTDFDYSARYDNMGTSPSLGPLFFGAPPAVSDLINTIPPNGKYPLGQPYNRFGHDQTNGTAAQNGLPREYDSNGTFIGRFTDEETSYSPSGVAATQWFGFPGYLPANGSPMARSTNVTLDSSGSYITQFQGGSHRGEDILLTNVVSFDVKILDPLYSESTVDLNRNGIIDSGPAPAFADLGHGAPTGVFAQAAANFSQATGTAAVSQYGPHPAITGDTAPNNVLDTWHPQFHFQTNTTATFDQPPYTGLPNLGDGISTPSPFWTASTPTSVVNYSVGQLVAPQPTVSTAAPVLIVNGLVYQCSTAGASGPTQPFGNFDTPLSTTGTPIIEAPPGTARWIAVLPVQAIQITVKYLDPTQNLLRQVTIVQQLTQ